MLSGLRHAGAPTGTIFTKKSGVVVERKMTFVLLEIVILIVLVVLLRTCELHWILNSFRFLKYLVVTYQTIISKCLASSDLESLRTKTAFESPWKGGYQVLPATQMAAEVQRPEAWRSFSQLKKALPGMWSWTNTGDLQIQIRIRIQLTWKRSSRH